MRWPWPLNRILASGDGQDQQPPDEPGAAISYNDIQRHFANVDFYQGRFAPSLWGLSSFRNVAIRYQPVTRCVTLISAVCTSLIYNTLYVMDSNHRRVDNRRTRKILHVLRETPDMGETSGYSFIEDVFADYCLDGNALLVVTYDSTGYPMTLRRYRPSDAQTTRTPEGALVYRLHPTENPPASSGMFAARDVIHFRWPKLHQFSYSNSGREPFGPAPIWLLRNAIASGLMGDDWVEGWWADGPKGNLHVSFAADPNIVPKTPKERKEIINDLSAASRKRDPLVSFGGRAEAVESAPGTSVTSQTRDRDLEDVASTYGLPRALFSKDFRVVKGLNEELTKSAFRMGIKGHLDRFLSAFGLRLLQEGERLAVDTTEFLRGDSSGMAELVMALQGDMQRAPVATREELRHMAGLPRDADGEFVQPMPSPDMPTNDEEVDAAKKAVAALRRKKETRW